MLAELTSEELRYTLELDHVNQILDIAADTDALVCEAIEPVERIVLPADSLYTGD